MAWMIYQQYTTAILDAYQDDPDVGHHLEEARAHREGLESLEIDDGIQKTLVEQALTIEEAFERLGSARTICAIDH